MALSAVISAAVVATLLSQNPVSPPPASPGPPVSPPPTSPGPQVSQPKSPFTNPMPSSPMMPRVDFRPDPPNLHKKLDSDCPPDTHQPQSPVGVLGHRQRPVSLQMLIPLLRWPGF